jgi:hypothetical protein
MWDLWWTKWHWGRFSPSNSVSPANHHSTKFFILIITRATCQVDPIGLHPPPPIRIKKITASWNVTSCSYCRLLPKFRRNVLVPSWGPKIYAKEAAKLEYNIKKGSLGGSVWIGFDWEEGLVTRCYKLSVFCKQRRTFEHTRNCQRCKKLWYKRFLSLRYYPFFSPSSLNFSPFSLRSLPLSFTPSFPSPTSLPCSCPFSSPYIVFSSYFLISCPHLVLLFLLLHFLFLRVQL